MVAPRRPIDWLDRCAALASGKRRLFTGGWGDEALVNRLVETRLDGEPYAVEPVWGAAKRQGGVVVSDGWFESPFPGLPPEAARAHLRRLSPASDSGEELPAYVVLASSGDEGWAMRSRVWQPLVERGVCEVLLLENPMYGLRRPAGQLGPKIRTVAEHLVMNVGTIAEARALLASLTRQGRRRLGIAGYSMGGCMAAVVAALARQPLAAAIFAAGRSAVPIFTEGLLADGIDFAALGGRGPGCGRIASLFSLIDLDRLAPPERPDAAVLVAAKRDGYVFADEVDALATCWRGSELRWVDTGHAGALLFHASTLRQAAVDALARLG